MNFMNFRGGLFMDNNYYLIFLGETAEQNQNQLNGICQVNPPFGHFPTYLTMTSNLPEWHSSPAWRWGGGKR